jgi:hypothetical protein
MGCIADMMLEGILCACCGAAMDDVGDDDFDTPGYPRYCSAACEPDDVRVIEPVAATPKVSCPTCKRRVKAAGLHDHMRAKHGGNP